MNSSENTPEANKKTAKEELWQAVKFTLFSASAGLIQIGSFALLRSVIGLEQWISYLVSLILSVLWNFTFNRRYTFRSDANIARAMALTALYYAVFTPISTWWSQALVNIGWHDYIVEIGTMLVNFVTEFIYQKFVVYRGTIDTNDVAKRAAEKKNGNSSAESIG